MAAKKFDLGAYNTDTRKTQAKHNKYSAFLENENASTEDIPLKNTPSDKTVTDDKASKAPASENGVTGEQAADKTASKSSAEGNPPKKKASSAPKGSAAQNITEPIKAASPLDPNVPTLETHTGKRINMAFSDANYKLISEESERLSVSFVYFINSLIRIADEEAVSRHIGAMTIRRSKDNISRRKGKPAKRINLKFEPEQHSKLCRGAESFNMTVTQYMNTIIEVYAQDMHRTDT